MNNKLPAENTPVLIRVGGRWSEAFINDGYWFVHHKDAGYRDIWLNHGQADQNEPWVPLPQIG